MPKWIRNSTGAQRKMECSPDHWKAMLSMGYKPAEQKTLRPLFFAIAPWLQDFSVSLTCCKIPIGGLWRTAPALQDFSQTPPDPSSSPSPRPDPSYDYATQEPGVMRGPRAKNIQKERDSKEISRRKRGQQKCSSTSNSCTEAGNSTFFWLKCKLNQLFQDVTGHMCLEPTMHIYSAT